MHNTSLKSLLQKYYVVKIACTELEESHSCAANAASNDRNLDQIGAFRDDLHIKLNFLYKHRRSDCGIAYTRSAQLQDMIETSASSDSKKRLLSKAEEATSGIRMLSSGVN